MRAAVLRALAEANGDYEVVAGLLGLPLSAVYALVGDDPGDGVIEDLLERRTSNRRK